MRLLSRLDLKTLAGKTCLLRVNLDIKNPSPESFRLEAALPTIRFLLNNNARPLIISHRGRPTGADLTLSIEPAIKILQAIYWGETPIGLDWLENLRFDPREEKNDKGLARELAAKADFYVNDDFAASHRNHASLVAITKFLPAYAGLLLEKEITMLTKIRDNPARPLVVIIGGIKIADKISVIENLKDTTAAFLMGSAYPMPRETMPSAENIILPMDWREVDGEKLDIGSETIKQYEKIIAGAKTIIWVGPVGNIENKPYDTGSHAIAKAIIASKAFSVVGGGDTVDFLAINGLLKKFSFVSTGGGAMLAFLAGKNLPAITALDALSSTP